MEIGMQQGEDRQARAQQETQQGPPHGVEASGVFGDGKATGHG